MMKGRLSGSCSAETTKSRSSGVVERSRTVYIDPLRSLTKQANRRREDGAPAPPASSPVERVVRPGLLGVRSPRLLHARYWHDGNNIYIRAGHVKVRVPHEHSCGSFV